MPTARRLAPGVCRHLWTWLLVAALLLAPGRSHAQGSYDTLRPGESLAAFARRHGTDAAAIRRANRLSESDQPKAGTRLFVPQGTPARSTTSVPASRPAAAPSAAKPPPTAAPPTRAAAPGGSYTVQAGDTLTGVARRHQVTVEALAAENGLATNAALRVGQRLRIPGRNSAVAAAASTAQPAPTTSAPPRPAAEAPAPPRPRDPAPAPPRPAQTASGGSNPPAPTGTPSRRGFIWPIEGRVLNRFADTPTVKRFGIDIAAPFGTPVRAARDGRVIYASDLLPVYGRMVIVEHEGGLATCYAHLSSMAVRQGDRVTRGQVIGRVGDTGKTIEPALHFEVRRNGDAVNPEDYLP